MTGDDTNSMEENGVAMLCLCCRFDHDLFSYGRLLHTSRFVDNLLYIRCLYRRLVCIRDAEPMRLAQLYTLRMSHVLGPGIRVLPSLQVEPVHLHTSR